MRAEHSAVVDCHGLHRETSALYEVHAYIAGLEKCSRHQAATTLRIPLVASLADDLVGVVMEPLAGCQRAAGLAVEPYPFSVGNLASLDMYFRKNVNRLDCYHILNW